MPELTFPEWLKSLAEIARIKDCFKPTVEAWADLADLCAQLYEAAKEEHDHKFAIPATSGHDCAKNAEAGGKLCIALEAARELKEKYA